MALLYGVTSFYIFFLARRRPSPTLFQHREPVHVVPLRDKLWYFRYHDVIPSEMSFRFFQDFFGNIALFVPLPFFLLAMRPLTSLKQVLLVAAGISLSVEITQFLLSIGVADVDDIILNTLGAFMGYFVAKRFFRHFPRFVSA